MTTAKSARGMRGAGLAKLIARVLGPRWSGSTASTGTPSAALPCCT